MARPKFSRFKKHVEPRYILDALQRLLPPDDISPSEWAAKFRILNQRSSYITGLWQNQKTPYLVGVMDEIMNYGTEETIFCKPSQVGGTEGILNVLGWIIQEDPSPTLLVYPSDELGTSILKNRIIPMIREAPTLLQRYHESESSLSELQFDGMYLAIIGSNSASQLASRPIRYLLLDEVDKFPGASKREADAISLARERTKTFRNRKIIMASTPTLKTGNIWRAMESADEIRHYMVPCPHCGKPIEFHWQQVKFPGSDTGLTEMERADFAAYVCQECGGIITDREKPAMLSGGRWETVSKNSSYPRRVAFWMNTLYSPFVRFSEVAREFLRSRKDPDMFQNFTNSWLAEAWEDTKLKTNADTVKARQTELREFEVPEWAKLLTGGVDVQETSLYWTIRAWGDYLTSQTIACGQAYNFQEIERIMNLQYCKKSGEQYVVSLAIIDSGNDTDNVYSFCADNSDWAIPGKGASHTMDSHFRISKVNRIDSKAYGMALVMIDTGKYKDMIAGRMARENGTGAWMVYGGISQEYAEQVTSEHKVNERHGDRVVQVWRPKASHIANHFLDCEVYAFCAADICGVRTLHLQQLEQKPRESTPVQESTPAPEESWLSGNDSWLFGGG